MSKFSKYIGSQMGNPRGLIGKICCIIMNIINKPMYQRTIALVAASKSDCILDIGYGNGQLLKGVYQKTRATMYGIDISEDMKAHAQKRNKRAVDDGKLFLSVGDCCDLQYEDAFFGAVSSINTIYFWKDTVKGLTDIRRVLKEGASFYNVVYTKEWLDKSPFTQSGFKKYEPEQLIEFGKQAGYDSVSLKEIVKGKSFVVIYTK